MVSTLEPSSATGTRVDPRNIAHGHEIPREGYCDQPYVVQTDDGSWLCVMTTGPGVEGDTRQHVISTTSGDHGKTWLPPVDIEPNGPPEASWVMPLKVPSGRVYAFYVYNGDNMREVESLDGEPMKRVDTLGHLVFKYSDDNGQTWSAERYRIPLRTTEIDRANVYGGDVHFFWGVGKPVVHETEGAVYFGAAKVGNFLRDGFMHTSEGIFLKSDNILTEDDPDKVHWEMLPDGDIGLRAPNGPVADEHNLTVLDDGSLYCTYRTIDGYLCHAYSRDGGHTWDGPQYATYTPDGRRIKHNRAANFVRKYANGNYSLWFHNHAGHYYMSRNPAWLCGGVERDGFIHWSEPEIVLYDDYPGTRISYPDFIEEDGRYWITETQKSIARVHEIDPSLLEGMWSQTEHRAIAARGLALQVDGDQMRSGTPVTMPDLPKLSEGGGFAIDLWITPDDMTSPQTIFNTRTRGGWGVMMTLQPHGALQLSFGDRESRIEEWWDTGPEQLRAGVRHHVVLIVDGGPKIMTLVIDGKLYDGGADRPKGWHRFSSDLGDVNGSPSLTRDPSLVSTVHNLRIYDRYLRTSEAVGNFQAGMP